MLTFYGYKTKNSIAVDTNGELPPHANWIDAFDPTEEDMSFLRRVMKVRVPTLADLVEIESSSRLSSEGETLIMSLPITRRDETGFPRTTPLGFVLSRERVVTIRFEHLPSFENLAAQICAKGDLAESGLGAMVTILEIVVDHLADLMERVGTNLDEMSHSVFSGEMIKANDRRPRHTNEALKQLLQDVGRNGSLVSKVSETLLGLSRIAPYLTIKAASFMTPDFKTRLETVSLDTKSLHEFQEHLTNKTQFLVDALLGLANIEQNNVFRVLTVVSVIGIPPTFVASMYGMNFKNMPELEWSHGYAFGLTLIALSAIAPALWFKLKGWW